MKLERGVAQALRDARAAGLSLQQRPAGSGVRILHGAILQYAADTSPAAIQQAITERMVALQHAVWKLTAVVRASKGDEKLRKSAAVRALLRDIEDALPPAEPVPTEIRPAARRAIAHFLPNRSAKRGKAR